MALRINQETQERIFDLVCSSDGCGKVGGSITFTFKQVAFHGGDEVLEAKLKAKYRHECDDHKIKVHTL